MATKEGIRREVAALGTPDAIDIVRRRKLAKVHQLTGRSLVVYAVDFTTGNPFKGQLLGPAALSISLSDKDGIDEVTRDLGGPGLDVLIHSPGGTAEATESIVKLLRSRFEHIRFIVPDVAKSAATMMVMSGNQILMDERSELGPIDPQLFMTVDNRTVIAPAQAIKDQFVTAQQEVTADQSKLVAWIPILRMYGPSLLAQCDNHLKLAEGLVSQWLQSYMFAGDPEAIRKAAEIARYLNDHNRAGSHERRIGMDDLTTLGLDILDMRQDPDLHEAIRDLYNSIIYTFANTGAYKIFENHLGMADISQIALQANVQAEPQVQPGAANPQSPAKPRLDRQQRGKR